MAAHQESFEPPEQDAQAVRVGTEVGTIDLAGLSTVVRNSSSSRCPRSGPCGDDPIVNPTTSDTRDGIDHAGCGLSEDWSGRDDTSAPE